MTDQLENPEVLTTEETITAEAARRRLDHVAEETAEKGSRTEQSYDQTHEIFSK